jgi:transposase-like protein
MSRRKTSGRPKAERVAKPNMVAAAVDLSGGVTAVAKLCGVSRQTVYTWIQDWRVERLIDALKLSRASGIPIEKLAGAAFDDSEGTSGPAPPGRPRAKPESE